MKKGVLLIVTALLTACSQAESASESPVTDRVSETSITSSAETAKPAETTEPAKETFITIDAEIVSYKNGELTFLYGGESYTLPMEREQFKENEVPFKHSKLISEQIIGSRPGEKVPAAITVNEDMTRIRLCDVIRPNGKVFDSDKYSLHRTEGSKIELTGSGGIPTPGRYAAVQCVLFSNQATAFRRHFPLRYLMMQTAAVATQVAAVVIQMPQ